MDIYVKKRNVNIPDLAGLLISIRSPHTSNIKTRLAYKTGIQRHETTALSNIIYGTSCLKTIRLNMAIKHGHKFGCRVTIFLGYT